MQEVAARVVAALRKSAFEGGMQVEAEGAEGTPREVGAADGGMNEAAAGPKGTVGPAQASLSNLWLTDSSRPSYRLG